MYEFYLFSRLWHIYNSQYDKTEYDKTYSKIESDWENFIKSNYNEAEKPLYECICNYLKSLKN